MRAYRFAIYLFCFLSLSDRACSADASTERVTFDAGSAAYKSADFARALAIWSRLADAGDRDATYNLACMAAGGRGQPTDKVKARVLFRKAEAEGDLSAKKWLQAEDQSPKIDAGQKWFTERRESGRERSDRFRLSFRAAIDEHDEIVWTCSTDRENGADVTFATGLMLETGTMGLPRNGEIAARFYRMSAVRQNAAAKTRLAYMLAGGHGIPADPAGSVQLFKEAAQQGDRVAMSNLANFYAHGLAGFQKNEIMAYALLRLATNRGEKVLTSPMMAELDGHLSPAQEAAAEAIVVEWRPGHDFAGSDSPGGVRVP